MTLAADLMINRNTAARAYKILEEQGVILTAGRKGTFVRGDAAAEVARLQSGHAQRLVRHTIDALIADGLNRDEIFDIFRKALSPGTGKG